MAFEHPDACSGGATCNKAQLTNTLDPMPYLGMNVNIVTLVERLIGCC